jgi:hypothetical protein
MRPFLNRRSNSNTVTCEVLLDSYLFKNFTRMSKSEFEFLLNAIYWSKNIEKRYEYEKRHTYYNKTGDYTTFCGHWRFVHDFNVPLQSACLFYKLHSTGSLWHTDTQLKGIYQGKLNSNYCYTYSYTFSNNLKQF